MIRISITFLRPRQLVYSVGRKDKKKYPYFLYRIKNKKVQPIINISVAALDKETALDNLMIKLNQLELDTTLSTTIPTAENATKDLLKMCKQIHRWFGDGNTEPLRLGYEFNIYVEGNCTGEQK